MQNKHFFIMKKALFVGSFNPITKAHQNIVRDLLNNKVIDYLYYLPVNSFKSDLIDIKYRIEMINLVKKIKSEVLNIYNYSSSGLFNYDILKKINLDINYLVMGSDLFLKFNSFKNYKKIISEYYLIIINRNMDIEEYINNNYMEYKDKIIIINKNYKGSSKIVKEELKKYNSSKYLDNKVLDYIIKNNLYN